MSHVCQLVAVAIGNIDSDDMNGVILEEVVSTHPGDNHPSVRIVAVDDLIASETQLAEREYRAFLNRALPRYRAGDTVDWVLFCKEWVDWLFAVPEVFQITLKEFMRDICRMFRIAHETLVARISKACIV
jgi:hypothetical protein